MRDTTLSQLGDAELLRDLRTIVAQDRSITAALLAHLAEVDSRRLYAPAGYPSMESYCIHELRFSEDAAHRRIRAARCAREYPKMFEMLADGRLNLSAVVRLGSWLRPENAAELLAAAANKTRSELEEVIAEHFPSTELPLAVPAMVAATHSVPESSCQVAPAPPVTQPPTQAAPIARHPYMLALPKDTHEKLDYARALMSHVAGCNEAKVVDRALDSFIAQLEKRRFGATSRPRASQPTTRSTRHIPARVKRAVWQRDGGRCTYTTETGHRCPARHLLQYDHVTPVARGGDATVENLRIRCATHNRFEAERIFGTEFMAEKRAARERATTKRTRDEARERMQHAKIAPRSDSERDIAPWLRSLGCKPEHIRLAAQHCQTLPEETSLDDRVREAIRYAGRLRYPRAFRDQALA